MQRRTAAFIQRRQGPQASADSSATSATSASTSITTSPTSQSTTIPTSSSSSTPSTSSPSSSPSSRSSTTSTPSTSSTSQPGTTVTQVITPTTVVVIGTQTFTSTLPPTTTTSSAASSTASSGASNSGSSSLSTGAKVGIIVGSVVAGLALLALLVLACLAIRRKRQKDIDAKENIKWPEIVASAEDRAALYPEQTHRTGRAGLGDDEMDEVAGSGASTVYSGSGRWKSQSSGGHAPTLPTIPPSVYSETTYSGAGAGGAANGYYPPSSASPYSSPQSHAGFSNHGHAPLAPGPASIDYQQQMQQRNTPSPPRGGYASQGPASSNGHGAGPGDLSGNLPLPGSSDHDHYGEPLERSVSPTPMQVGGGPFGPGYDESNGSRNWRLSVVNDDPR
ncbi:hypothetical protein T439DRAFT_79741 [Meredithblackwellia eburnea MCA 4105]